VRLDVFTGRQKEPNVRRFPPFVAGRLGTVAGVDKLLCGGRVFAFCWCGEPLMERWGILPRGLDEGVCFPYCGSSFGGWFCHPPFVFR